MNAGSVGLKGINLYLKYHVSAACLKKKASQAQQCNQLHIIQDAVRELGLHGHAHVYVYMCAGMYIHTHIHV